MAPGRLASSLGKVKLTPNTLDERRREVMALLILYLSLALFISFLCSILEAVYLSITPFYVEVVSTDRSLGQKLKKLKETPEQSLSAILILNTFAHTIGAAGVGAQSVKVFGERWEALTAVVLTLIILYFSEILPKTLGTLYWRKLVVFSTHVIGWLIVITTPFLWISNLFGHKKKLKSSVTREEIECIAELGEKEGVLVPFESDLIENLLSLKKFKAKDILSPKSVVFSLNGNLKINQISSAKDIVPHSRIPVFEGNPENIVGLVFSKTLLQELAIGDGSQRIKNLAVDIFRVNENIPVIKLIHLFITRKEHMFLVTDQYEQMLGIVTLEDAIETLLGVEIVDEMDVEEDMQELARRRADEWREAYEKLKQKQRK